MADGISFRVYDPVAQLLATGGGSGGGLPLTGGTLSGNLTLTSPAKIIQCQEPSNICDLVNMGYADETYQVLKPAAASNNLAIFGSGSDTGQTTDSGFSIDTNLANPSSNVTLWPSSRLIGALQYGCNVYKATASIIIPPVGSVKAFSTGNANAGLVTWPNFGTTFSLAPTGIATISNSLEFTTYFKISFTANSLSESTNQAGSAECSFQIESGGLPEPFGVKKTLKVLVGGGFSNEVFLTATTSVAPGGSFSFSTLLTNVGLNTVTVDPTAPENPCLLIIERFG